VLKLMFFYMEGCPACTKAKPVLKKFEDKHKGRVQVVRHDINKDQWAMKGWEVQATPTYLIQDTESEHPGVFYQGAMSAAEMDKFLAKAMNVLEG
jgi:thioredoxin-like negative regulator of GroEL